MSSIKTFADLKRVKVQMTRQAKRQALEREQRVQEIEQQELDHRTFAQEMQRLGVKKSAPPSDCDLFSREMEKLGVQALGITKRRIHEKKRLTIPEQSIMDEKRVLSESLSDEFDAVSFLDTDEDLSFTRPWVSDDITKKLRRGYWTIQAHLDLHGMRTDQAREEVALFIHRAVKAGLRCIRIVHGKGLNSQGAPVLKIRTRRWLRQKQEVLAYVEAPPEDGGSGAVRILLAKKSQ